MKYYQKVLFAILCGVCFCTIGLEAKSFAQSMAIDPSGAGVAVWNTKMNTFNSVQAAAISSSGVWSLPVTLSNPGVDTTFPLVVVDSSGNAIAMWSEFDSVMLVNTLQIAILPFGGSWTSPLMISSPTEDVASFSASDTPPYTLVMNNTGTIVAVWSAFVGADLVIRSANFNNSLWSFPQTVSP
ncbi:MAG: hypothetical protein KBA81_01365 [Rhabdochlamydiaceae bacterium]|nr:hypothetical protein [Rhabdochlamydiaceae bacterium]